MLLRLAVFAGGAAVVVLVLGSAVRSFVLPRSAPDYLANRVFRMVRIFVQLSVRWARTFEQRDQRWAFYAPIALLALQVTWLTLVLLGYTAIYWAIGVESWREAFKLSGSSLLTIGFAGAESLAVTAVAFSEAGLGLIMVALLIASICRRCTRPSRVARRP